MARKLRKPRYCGPHNPSGLAYVWWDGKRHYLGPHDTRESRAAYEKFLRDNFYVDEPEPEPPGPDGQVELAHLLVEYLNFAVDHYAESPAEVTHLRSVIRFLLTRVAAVPIVDFGPRRLKEVQRDMVEHGSWNRRTINQHIQRVRRIFKWGVSEEIVPARIWDALRAVEGLRKGRTSARESRIVTPAIDEHVDAVIDVVSPIIGAMIRLQQLTGMRSGNLVAIRPVDLSHAGDLWYYVPERHKTAWKGKNLSIVLGPKCQQLLAPFIGGRAVDEFIFSPREAAFWHAIERRKRRRALPKSLRDKDPKVRNDIRDHYDSGSYRTAVQRGARKCGVPCWTPNQLRHSRATIIRKEYGVEAAQVFLGHTKADVTQIYAERDLELARKVARNLA